MSRRPTGVGGWRRGPDAVGDAVEGVDVEGELHAGLGAELVHEGAGTGVAGDVLKQQRGATGAVLRVPFELRCSVGDLGHLEVGADGVFDDDEFARAVEAVDPFAKVFVGQFPALLVVQI